MRTPIALLLLLAACCHAETYSFGTGTDAFEMEFVTIGAIGNPHDSRTDPLMGSVAHEYEIGKFEVSCGMFQSADRAGVFGPPFGDTCNGPEDLPITFSGIDAYLFVNWLNSEAGYAEAYKINDLDGSGIRGRIEPWEPNESGYNSDNLWRNSRAKFVIPNADEWHKAAYYDTAVGVYRNYATGDATPTPTPASGGTSINTANVFPNASLNLVDMAGGLSAFGTMGQTGNASEWEEYSLPPGVVGPTFKRKGLEDGGVAAHLAAGSREPSISNLVGLRIAAVTPIPEPSSLTLLASMLCSLGAFRRRHLPLSCEPSTCDR